jgi:Zn-dependent oligopeptidase
VLTQCSGSIGALSHRFAGGEGAALAPLLNARRELARLLGHASYAEYVLPSRVLGSVAAVETLLDAMEVSTNN